MEASKKTAVLLNLTSAICAPLAFLLVLLNSATTFATDKFRVVIMTDMTHDDGNSLIRYLYYANEFDTEAIIVTPQLPDYNYNSKGPWEKVNGILAAYSDEYSQLKKHHSDYPSPESLLKITKKGRGALPIIWLTNTRTFRGHIADRYVESEWGDIKLTDWIGEGQTPHGEPKDSEGSELLLQIFEKEEDRPIFVQMWGGPITFVQALYRFRQKHGDAKLDALMAKLHVFGIHLQDITFDLLINLDDVQALDCLNMGDVRSTYQGKRFHPRWFLLDRGHFWHYVGSKEPGYVKPMTAEEVRGHGAMSELYDNGGEGDSPSFLYLVSARFGLNDPLAPDQGSWGSLFTPMGEPFPDGYYSTCNVDKSHLTTWVDDAKHSFENRLEYSRKDPDEVNHRPVLVVGGKSDNRVEVLEVKRGTTVQLDASGSRDPDNDQISYNWFFYPEPSTVRVFPVITDPSAAKVKFEIPDTAKAGTLHLILELKDSGVPSLTSYKRFILQF